MQQIFKISIILILGLIYRNSLGQSADTTKISSLIVYGDSFVFGVKKPTSWKGDIEIAKDFSSNIIFYKNKSDLKNGGALIQISIFSKQDEETEEDLKYDISRYTDKYTDLKEQNLLISHGKYKCFSKMVYVEKNFYQYIVYINPGEKFKNGLSVAMNISKRAATEEELQTFRDIIFSLVILKG